MNRRNILTVLGLAGVTTPAVAIESLDTLHSSSPINIPKGVGGLMQGGQQTQELIAQTLEHMAEAIRNGRLTATDVEIVSKAGGMKDWMTHEIKFTCELGLHDPDAVA